MSAPTDNLDKARELVSGPLQVTSIEAAIAWALIDIAETLRLAREESVPQGAGPF